MQESHSDKVRESKTKVDRALRDFAFHAFVQTQDHLTQGHLIVFDSSPAVACRKMSPKSWRKSPARLLVQVGLVTATCITAHGDWDRADRANILRFAQNTRILILSLLSRPKTRSYR
jgi:hypothetical protein